MLWRWVCLRGAGLPAIDLLRLAAPKSARIGDLLIQEEERALQWAVERARQALAGEDARAPRRRLRRDLTRLAREAPLALASAMAGEDREAQEFAARLQHLRGEFDRVFGAEELEVSASLHDLASNPRLREAVLWQNREAFRTGLEHLLRKPPGAGHRRERRAREHLVASYLQRYCVKNDSIGFFGPVGWGRIVDEGPAVCLEPGPELVAKREVYFEDWCIDSLARKLGESDAVRASVAPRPIPYLHLEGRQIRIPGQESVELSPQHALLLASCDGQRTARAIAELLVADPTVPFSSSAEVYELLELSRQGGLISWSLEGPLELHPERRLRQRLEGVADVGVRASALAALSELEAARAAVAASAGYVAELDHAFEGLETSFERLTGASPTRRHGETYASRTLVYEDCRRDVKLEIGPDLLGRLGPPLSLVLASARWLAWDVARRDCEAIERAYAEVAYRDGSPVVDLGSVLLLVPSLSGEEEADVAVARAAQVELQRRWAEVLCLTGGERQVRYRSDALRARVEEAFAVPGPGWRWPRYISPDIMIAAPDVESVNRGDCQIVLGEVHLLNTLLSSCLVSQHPRPAELLAGLEADRPEPCVVAVLGKGGTGQRTNIGLLSTKDFFYDSNPEGAVGDPARALRPSELVLERVQAGLEVRTLDGRARFDLLDFFGHLLTYRPRVLHLNPLSMVMPGGHGPRITVDDVVLWRERWQFTPTALAFAAETDAAGRFLGARRWARAHGLPRFVFFRVPVERKPCYVDLDSPLYVELLCKLIRRTAASGLPDATVSLSEMLPTIDQSWLVDAQDRHYTSELRVAAWEP
jgi:hypothetical protein